MPKPKKEEQIREVVQELREQDEPILSQVVDKLLVEFTSEQMERFKRQTPRGFKIPHFR